MNVYKLVYSSRKALDSALKSRQILEDNEGKLVYAKGTHAVVYLGNIVLENAEYDSQGNEIKPPVLSDKYHADIMVDGSFKFGDNEVKIKEGEKPIHSFA